MTCFSGEKLGKKQENSRQYKGIEYSKSDYLNNEKEKISFLKTLCQINVFLEKKSLVHIECVID